MLRVIDQRVDDAVRSLVAHVLNAGGRIVHGGHPKITKPLAEQANLWAVTSEPVRPVLLYQSELFREWDPPRGREEMREAGTAEVRWVTADLSEVAQHWEIPDQMLTDWLPAQAAPEASSELRKALLAMRLQMLLGSQPRACVCIGGMEGIEAEVRLYLELIKLRRIPKGKCYVITSTYGAAAQLHDERMYHFDRAYLQTVESLRPSPETARAKLERRISYDPIMSALVADIRRGFG